MSEQEAGGGKFDPSRYLRQIRNRGGSSDYLDVKWRLVWLRSEHPDAQIGTEHVTITSDMAIFKAQVSIPGGGSATGYGSETIKDFTDFIEKAETKALGRALLALGFGTEAVQELNEAVAPEPATPLRTVPPRAEQGRTEPRPESAARPFTAPQPAVAQRGPSLPPAPRSEPIPADVRRPVAPRPIRESEPDLPPFGPVDEFDEPREEISAPAPRTVSPAPAPTPERVATRPAAMTPPLRPAPRPAPAPTPSSFTREPVEDGEDEVVDLANYGWTEFWSWARARGFNDRKSLDAVVGRPTNGMTPLEIRKQIQAKQG